MSHGRGKKHCPQGHVVGVRTRICNCGYEFPFKKNNEVVVKPKENGSTFDYSQFPGYVGGDIIYTPGINPNSKDNICPINVDQYNNIIDWAWAMYDYANRKNIYYTTMALKYLAKRKWDEQEVQKLDKLYEN